LYAKVKNFFANQLMNEAGLDSLTDLNAGKYRPESGLKNKKKKSRRTREEGEDDGEGGAEKRKEEATIGEEERSEQQNPEGGAECIQPAFEERVEVEGSSEGGFVDASDGRRDRSEFGTPSGSNLDAQAGKRDAHPSSGYVHASRESRDPRHDAENEAPGSLARHGTADSSGEAQGLVRSDSAGPGDRRSGISQTDDDDDDDEESSDGTFSSWASDDARITSLILSITR